MNIFADPIVPRTMRAIPGRRHKLSAKPKAAKPRPRDLEKARAYWAANKDRINAKRRAKAAKLRAKNPKPVMTPEERKEARRAWFRNYYRLNREAELERARRNYFAQKAAKEVIGRMA